MPDARMDLAFRALAAPVRRSLLDLLRDGPLRVRDLVAATGLSQSACSQHLAKLREAGLAIHRTDGRWARDADPLVDIEEWLTTHTFTWQATQDDVLD